jgi:branched-chain amino acid transport system permease protein
VAAAVVFPLLAGEGYVTHLVILMLISSVLATSLNVLMGFSGLVSMAHAAFFGIGGYASAILTTRHGLSFWVALPLATLITALVALVIGVPSFRTRGIYYIIVTIAFQLIASEVFDNWSSMTGGGLGLKGIPRPGGAIFLTRLGYYYLTLAVALGAHLLVVRVLRSPLGRALSAIRDNETKALMMGVSPLRYKLFAFVFASALAGVAGSLYVHYLEFAHPDFFNFAVSVDLFLTVMLGGAGTMYGPLFGVLVLEVIREVLHEFVALRLLLFGLLLIALILFLPEGVLLPLVRQFRRLPRARAAMPTAP